MIEQIVKEENDTELKVHVTCKVRKFASHEIKTLTTKDLSDILKKDHSIVNVLSEPEHKVGNSQRGKMQLAGTWVFSLVKKGSKPKTPRRARSSKKETSSETTEKKTKSIRSRMSSLSKK